MSQHQRHSPLSRLRQLAALLLTAFALAGCSAYSKAVVNSPAKIAVTERQTDLLKAIKRAGDSPEERMSLYLSAAHFARSQLVLEKHNALAQADYNFALGRLIEEMIAQKLKPWLAPVQIAPPTGASWTVTMPKMSSNPKLDPSNFRCRAADRYVFKGKLAGSRSIKQGVGAPVIVSGEDEPDELHFHPGKNTYIGMTAVAHFNGQNCLIEFIDPLEHETVSLNGQEFPLAANYQAPLALGMAELNPKRAERDGFLKPDQFAETARLGLLQPYNPTKIPVLCIHGLGNSVATWMPLVEHLRGNPAIRAKYQFLFFSYPTGIAYPMTTAILREKLDAFDERYPDHKDFVVLGHSMGGMMARLLITDSKMEIWDMLFAKPPSEMPFSPRTREVMESTLIFNARPDIDRVIFCSASHRGSKVAKKPLGKLGSLLIGDPIAENRITSEALTHVRPEVSLNGKRTRDRKHLPNSIDILDPESPFLLKINSMPLKAGIPYHSIIGDRGKGGHLDRSEPVSTDGVVPYWSTHLDGATSETVVPSGHWSHLHVRGMDEIERILVNHAG